MITFKTLHILNKSPEHSRYRLCLAAVGSEDAVLLTENGVLATARPPEIDPKRWFALGPDLQARGLSSHLSKDQTLSYDDMVELTATAENVISW
jgi:tRNA 2-thiouridine synthesizing protein B